MSRRYPLALACALALAACDKLPGNVSQYPVLVRAFDQLGKPLANVQLSAAGQPLGATEASGERSLTLPGAEGDRVDLSAVCPPGYAGPRERPSLLLEKSEGPQAPGAQAPSGSRPIELTFTCDSPEQVALIAIRTAHPNLPVMLRGQTVALTSSTGTAHVLVREAAGNSFQLTLDTSSRQDLRPESPARTFTVTQRDAFAVWNQPFELEKMRPPPKRLHRKRSHAAPIPELPPPKHNP